MWTMAWDAGRATLVRRGTGNLDDEWDLAFSALSKNDLRGLRAACKTTLDQLRSQLGQELNGSAIAPDKSRAQPHRRLAAFRGRRA
jgi:hypothetical protein